MKIIANCLLGLGSILLLLASASAQDWEVPRTPEGKPDLQGIWNNSSQTPLERPEEFGEKGFFTEQEANDQQQSWRDLYDQQGTDIDPNRSAPTDGNVSAGYNSFWWDPRDDVIQINGEYRTSIIVDPANGQIPFLEGERPQNHLRTQWRARPGVGKSDGPEVRGLADRCLVSFGSGGGPPMLPTLYNSNYQIVQTPNYVMILVEMVHDARIIRLNKDHSAFDFERWMGESVGYWDGDVLEVITKNFHPQQSFRGQVGQEEPFRGSSGQMVVTERFELIEHNKIKYRFTIEDPLTYQRPFTGEVAMNRTPPEDRMYEYACHEGNYALPGILSGARREEVDAAQQ